MKEETSINELIKQEEGLYTQISDLIKGHSAYIVKSVLKRLDESLLHRSVIE